MGRRAIDGTCEVPRMKYNSVIEAVQDNILAFLLGWLVGAGLAPMLVEQITSAL
jgi:hypothetical protein